MLAFREKCVLDEFSLIEKYCKATLPDSIGSLNEVATTLKSSLWEGEFDYTEMDPIIISHILTDNSNGMLSIKYDTKFFKLRFRFFTNSWIIYRGIYRTSQANKTKVLNIPGSTTTHVRF